MSNNSYPWIVVRFGDDVCEIPGILRDLSAYALPPTTSPFLHSASQFLLPVSTPGLAVHISVQLTSILVPRTANTLQILSPSVHGCKVKGLQNSEGKALPGLVG